MKLFTLTKFEQAGNSETKQTVVASGITKTMVNNLVAKSPKVVADTVFLITPII